MSETVRLMSPATQREIYVAVLQQMPLDIPQDIAESWIRNLTALGKVLREALMSPVEEKTPKPALSEFTVQVDYGKTVEQMVAVGAYDWKNMDITAANFPVNKRQSGGVVVCLIHFDKGMGSDEVIAELDAMGLRPAELPELLALGACCPNLQREYPIVALGSFWQRRVGRRYVPCLYRNGSDRDLDLYWYDLGWVLGCRFAAVSK